MINHTKIPQIGFFLLSSNEQSTVAHITHQLSTFYIYTHNVESNMLLQAQSMSRAPNSMDQNTSGIETEKNNTLHETRISDLLQSRQMF